MKTETHSISELQNETIDKIFYVGKLGKEIKFLVLKTHSKKYVRLRSVNDKACYNVCSGFLNRILGKPLTMVVERFKPEDGYSYAIGHGQEEYEFEFLMEGNRSLRVNVDLVDKNKVLKYIKQKRMFGIRFIDHDDNKVKSYFFK